MTWKLVKRFPPWLSCHSFAPNCYTLPYTLRVFTRSSRPPPEGWLYIASHQPSFVLVISLATQLCRPTVHCPGFHLALTAVVTQFHPIISLHLSPYMRVISLHLHLSIISRPRYPPPSNNPFLSPLFSLLQFFFSFAVFTGERVTNVACIDCNVPRTPRFSFGHFYLS